MTDRYGRILGIDECPGNWEGYRITTDKTAIEFKISGYQQCC